MAEVIDTKNEVTTLPEDDMIIHLSKTYDFEGDKIKTI